VLLAEQECPRQIEHTFDSESSTRLAYAAYLALTRIASDKQAESFECSVKEIAGYMHYRYDQALEGIKLAEAAGVIQIQRRKVPGTKENAHSIYTLLEVIGISDKVIDSPQCALNPESIEITIEGREKSKESKETPLASQAGAPASFNGSSPKAEHEAVMEANPWNQGTETQAHKASRRLSFRE
jgi:hypothetical protein